MHERLCLLVFMIFLWLVPPFGWNASGADWPQWRGPDRNDITPETSGWPEGWPPRELWRKRVGRGCTSPIVVGGRLYVMGWQGEGNLRDNPMGTDTIFCLDARTGEEIWKQSYPSRYQGRRRRGDLDRYGGPSSTPAWDAETQYLYTLSIDGELRCWDTVRQGEEVWSRNLYEDYPVPQRPNAGRGTRDYGYTTSPLILGSTLVVEVGSTQGTVMGFDKRTGEPLWMSACPDPGGHTSGPVWIPIGEAGVIADLTLFGLVLVRADAGHEGETFANYPWQTDFGCNIPTPGVSGQDLVITSGYNRRQTARLQVTPQGIREVWVAKPHAVVASPVIYRDRVYLLSGAVQCVDFETGELRWKGGRFGNGSMLVTAGDGRIIAFGEGDLALIEANPEGQRYQELARIEDVVPDVSYPHVVLSDGMLFCKDKAGNMVAFAVGR